MRSFAEVLSTIPTTVRFDIEGRIRIRELSEADRISAAREILAKERDVEMDRDRGGSVHAAALAEHIATLIEFHQGDDADQQHADPILSAFHPAELSCLRLKTSSGRQFVISIVELPA